tara:strand:- start:39 stop:350 length:312 start_codon:yes stop_codon:yes gene_type:complete
MILPLDLWAGSAAGVAGSTIAIRAKLLGAWGLAPRRTIVRMTFVSILLGMASFSVFVDDGASVREAIVYSAFALQAVYVLRDTLREHHPRGHQGVDQGASAGD